MFRRLSLLVCAALIAAHVPGQARAQADLTVTQARASMLGRWTGRLELLEGGVASEIFNWPVTVSIEDAGHGRIHIERESMEVAGTRSVSVRVTMLDHDGITEHRSYFTSGTTPEHSTLTLTLAAARDSTHWTLQGVRDYVYNGRSLQARLVITRDGNSLVTDFEVDPAGDEPPIAQRRRTLRRVGTETE